MPKLHLLSIYGTVFASSFVVKKLAMKVQENVKMLRILASSVTIDVTLLNVGAIWERYVAVYITLGESANIHLVFLVMWQLLTNKIAAFAVLINKAYLVMIELFI